MGTQIQTNYDTNPERGFVGQVARTNAPFDADSVIIGEVGLRTGQPFTLNAEGKARPLTGSAEAVPVEGVLMYSPIGINDPITGFIDEYPVGAKVEYMIEGYMFGVAGADLKVGDAVAYDPLNDVWMHSSAIVPEQAKVITSAEEATSGNIFVLKVGAKTAGTTSN